MSEFFFGACLTDRFSAKNVILSSFILSGVGMALLPFASGVWCLCLMGILAQAGQSMFPSSVQLLLKKTLHVKEQQEAVGWLRTVNNFGQIISYSIGWIFAASGPVGMMLFDSVTSFFAVLVAKNTLSNTHVHSPHVSTSSYPTSSWEKKGFWTSALMAACFSFLFELFMTGSAAKLRMLYGADGLSLFSRVMLINTVLCTLLSVVAAKKFKNPSRVLPLGIVLGMLGCLCLISQTPKMIFAGAFMLTLGEIMFMSLSSFVMLRLTPESRKSGSIFGIGTLVQVVGRTLGGAAAFPWIQSTGHPEILIFFVGGIGLLLGKMATVTWKELVSSN